MPGSHSVVADPEDHRAVVEEAREYAVRPAVATAVRRDSAVHRCDPPPIGRKKALAPEMPADCCGSGGSPKRRNPRVSRGFVSVERTGRRTNHATVSGRVVSVG